MTEWIEIDGVRFRVPQEVANAMRGLFADKADLLAHVERHFAPPALPDPGEVEMKCVKTGVPANHR